jgi:hypothetical protein
VSVRFFITLAVDSQGRYSPKNYSVSGYPHKKGAGDMKKVFAAILLLWAATSYAGQEAVTDTGEKVILNSDGTWVYADKAPKPVKRIETNKQKFEKPKDATFLVRSTRNNSAYWINSAKWSFKKTEGDAAAEYQFQLKSRDLYGMAVTEGIEMPLESLADTALANARSAAPDAKMIMQEYRVINGKKVVYMVINGTIKNVNFTYHGYYFSNSSGSTQLVAYTASNAVGKYTAEINDFLNGLVTK